MFQDMQIPVIGGNVIKKTPRLIMISDSYGRTATTGTSWQEELQSILNCECYKYWEGSMGVYRAGDGGHTALTLLQSHSYDIYSPEGITDIVFGIGVNDCVTAITQEQLGSAYDDLIAYCKTTYPNATIWFGFIGYSKNFILNESDGQFERYVNFIQVMQTKCAQYNCRYLDGVEYIMHDITIKQSDGVHPTAEGSRIIAEAINLIMNGSSYTYKKHLYTTWTYMNTSTAYKMLMSIDGNTSTIYVPQAYTTNTMNFSGAGGLNVGTITNPLFRGNTMPKMMHVWVTDTAYTKEFTSLPICFYNGNIYLYYVRSGSHSISGLQLNYSIIDYSTLYV